MTKLSGLTSQNSQLVECQACHDMGLIIHGDYATICRCQEVKRMKRLLKRSGISDAFRSKTFESYEANISILREAKKAAMKYVGGFMARGDGHYSIMLLGQPGAGKTHLAIAIANCLLDDFIPVLYTTYGDMVRELKTSQVDYQAFREAAQRYKEIEVLLLDDLFKNAYRQGEVRSTDLDAMFEIVNYRYMKKLPMVISGEHKTEELYRIDEALASRLIEMAAGRIITFDGIDLNYRMKGAVL